MLDDRDRAMGRVARLLVGISADDGLPERLGGMSLQVWLEHVGRIPGAEARALLGVADVLAHLPITLTGLCEGWLSWGQVQAIARAARRVPVARLSDLDGRLQDWMIDRADVEPDAVVADVWEWVDAAQPTRLEREEAARERDEFVTLMPRLFGGGSMYGEFGPIGFATLAEALDAPLAPPPAAPHDLTDDAAVAEAYDTLDEQRRQLTREHGARLARRLRDLCEQSLAGDPDAAPRPLLLATIGLDSLLDRDTTPGWLLHTLSGGRMRVSRSTLQRLVDERGADLRTIVLDDAGEIVGVGHRTHVPPTWMREAIWARDLAVRDPDGSTPVRRADLDHIDPWRDDGTGGATDVANLQPLGRRWHNRKTSRASGPSTADATARPSGDIAVMAGPCGWRRPDAAGPAPPPVPADRPARRTPTTHLHLMRPPG